MLEFYSDLMSSIHRQDALLLEMIQVICLRVTEAIINLGMVDT